MKLTEKLNSLLERSNSTIIFKTVQGLEHWLEKGTNNNYDGEVQIGHATFNNPKAAIKELKGK